MTLIRYMIAAAVASFAPAAMAVQIGNVSGSSINAVNTAYAAPMSYSLRAQQVYSHFFFTGPIRITDLTFSSTYLPSSMPAINNFTITLSTAKRGVGDATEDFAGNVGSDVKTFYSGSFASPTGASFTIFGNGFDYDPSKGDLLIDFSRNTPAAVIGHYLDAVNRNLSAETGGRFVSGGDYIQTVNPDLVITVSRASGLAVGINEAGAPAAVPEPATWAMMIAGFGIVGLGLRRRRQTLASYA